MLGPAQLPPEIASRFNELSISFQETPWIWIRTPDPIRKQTGVVSRITAHVPTVTGGTLWTDLQRSPPEHGGFGPEWDSHYYEAVGVLRYFNHAGLRFVAPPDGLPGQPPLWQGTAIGSDEPSIIAALWWQRAWSPTLRGIPPTLIAELRWWPGLIGAQPFFRPTTEADQSIETGHLRAAERARKLLYGLQLKLGQGGRPKVEREARIDRLAQAGCKWLKGHLYSGVADVGRPQIAEAMGDGDLARVNRVMERKPSFTNADVRRRMHEILESEGS